MEDIFERLVSMPLERLLDIISTTTGDEKQLSIKALGKRGDIQRCLSISAKELLEEDDKVLEATLVFCSNSRGMEYDVKLLKSAIDAKTKRVSETMGFPVLCNPLPKYEDVVSAALANISMGSSMSSKKVEAAANVSMREIEGTKVVSVPLVPPDPQTNSMNATMERRSTLADVSLAFDDSVEDTVTKTGTVTAYRVLLRYGTTFKLVVPHVSLMMREPKADKAVIYLETESPYVQQIEDIVSIYNTRNPGFKVRPSTKCQRGLSYVCNISTYTTFISSDGVRHTHEYIKRQEVVADVTLSFVEYSYNAKKFFHMRILEISATGGDDNHESMYSAVGLSMAMWMSMTYNDRRRYYSTGSPPSVEDNSLMNWCMVDYRGVPTICSRAHVGDEKGWYTVMDPREISGQDLKAYDPDGKAHYAVVLTTAAYKYDVRGYLAEDRKLTSVTQVSSEERHKIMHKATKYLKARTLDVKGIWYDQGRGGRAHVNLHVACELELPMFRAIFSDWEHNKGMVTVKRIYDPMGWRLYASRNHRMLEDDNALYREGREVHSAFYKSVEERGIQWRMTGRGLVSLLEYNIIE